MSMLDVVRLLGESRPSLPLLKCPPFPLWTLLLLVPRPVADSPRVEVLALTFTQLRPTRLRLTTRSSALAFDHNLTKPRV